MKKICKNYNIHAAIKLVYDALTKQDLLEKWSGSNAEMSTELNGKFSLWDGDIHGINRELSVNRVVQDWKLKSWAHYSKVTINLSKIDNNTHLELIHENIPQESFESLDKGWDDYYLGPLKALVEK